MSEIKVPLTAEERKFYEEYIGGDVGAPVVLALDTALVSALARIEHLEGFLKDLAEPLGANHNYTAEDVDQAVVDTANEALKGSPEEALHCLYERLWKQFGKEGVARLQDKKWEEWQPHAVIEALGDEKPWLKNLDKSKL